MAILRLVYLIPLVLVTCGSQHTRVFATQFQVPGAGSHFRELPCPNAEDIEPCICTFQEDDGGMDMDCTSIADEQELYAVFHADIPVSTFRNLTLGNDHLEALSDDVFGDATFEKVWTQELVWPGTLKSVGPETFIKSASTLRVLDLSFNELKDFPFETLSQYTQLTAFSVHGNPISSFPIIASETLRGLNLGWGAYDTIPAGALDSLPNLEAFQADYMTIVSMAPGLFTSLPKLRYIDMGGTDLTHLESLQFEVNSDAVIEGIFLFYNMIETVDADAFKGVESGIINLWNNQLTILPEATWGPLMDAGVQLSLYGNNLTCGCDVAWLVLEPTYHELVADAECQSGEMLVELDPSDFEDCIDEVMRL